LPHFRSAFLFAQKIATPRLKSSVAEKILRRVHCSHGFFFPKKKFQIRPNPLVDLILLGGFFLKENFT